MIKVIVGYKVKEGADILPILQKLASHAAYSLGFIRVENLVSQKDPSIITVISTWEKAGDWMQWKESIIRKQLLKEAATLLEEEPRVTSYRVVLKFDWK
ncbi:MAG: antibiotic biosynthesis monooxygenase [Chloroflexota bacterium]